MLHSYQIVPELVNYPCYEEYRALLRRLFIATNRQETLAILVMQGSTSVRYFYTLQVRESYTNPLSQTLSSYDCNMDGEERESRVFPLNSTIN